LLTAGNKHNFDFIVCRVLKVDKYSFGAAGEIEIEKCALVNTYESDYEYLCVYL